MDIVQPAAGPSRAAGRIPPLGLGALLAAPMLYAACYAARGFQMPWPAAGVPPAAFIEGLAQLLLLPLVVFVLARAVAERLLPVAFDAAGTARFWRLHAATQALWLAAALVAWRGQPTPALSMAALALQLLLQSALAGVMLPAARKRELSRSGHYLASLFLLSGFAALIYQVAWQRILFTEFGVNSESVTAIVSVFMFGLGVGALAGGYLQRRYPGHLVTLFIAIEIGIGLFGLGSASLIRAVSPASEPTMWGLVGRVYAVLALPTFLMGATLPVLIAHFQKHFRDIGRTVSLLYALNTFGSALAAFATVQVLFPLTGLRASIALAAACNFATAWLVYRASRDLAGEGAPQEAPAAPGSAPASASLPYPLALLALAAIGYLSLSLEILWYRLVGFTTANRPEVFGMLLAVYLAGIAAGSLRASRASQDDGAARRRVVQGLLLAAVAAYLAVPVTSWVAALAGKAVAIPVAYAGAAAVAFWCGGVFPSLVQLATRDRRSSAAMPVAWLYFANIAGAALGPLLTGFILLDRLPLASNLALVAALLLALALALAGRPATGTRWRLAGSVAGLALLGAALYAPLQRGHLERLQHARADAPPFRHVLQDRSAILTVDAAGEDIMYGDGIYDGRFNIDPVRNSNGIDRAFLVAALHPQPRRVLEIGLSTGSWTRVLSRYEPVEEMVVVEIGRGYQQVMRNYPQVASVLSDPKVRIHLDDGRRWLKNHPDEKFDVIVMNLSYPWRSNTTNLLSRDFLEMARTHLRPGGVIYYNALGWEHVHYTAAQVFPHVSRIGGFVVAADTPFVQPPERRRQNLLRFLDAEGRPVFRRDAAHAKRLEELVAREIPELGPALRERTDLWLITDDNMATEYKVRY